MNLLRGIYNHFGVEIQANKIVEEANEIVQAIKNKDMFNLTEEIADLKVLNNQVISVHKIPLETSGDIEPYSEITLLALAECLASALIEDEAELIKLYSLRIEAMLNGLIKSYSININTVHIQMTYKINRTLDRISTGYYEGVEQIG